jgi:hypothetical protein
MTCDATVSFIAHRFSSDVKEGSIPAALLLDSEEGRIGGDWKGDMQKATRDAQVVIATTLIMVCSMRNGACALINFPCPC